MSLRTVHVAVIPGETRHSGCGLRTTWEARELVGCNPTGDVIATGDTFAEAKRKARAEDKRRRREEGQRFHFHHVRE